MRLRYSENRRGTVDFHELVYYESEIDLETLIDHIDRYYDIPDIDWTDEDTVQDIISNYIIDSENPEIYDGDEVEYDTPDILWETQEISDHELESSAEIENMDEIVRQLQNHYND